MVQKSLMFETKPFLGRASGGILGFYAEFVVRTIQGLDLFCGTTLHRE